MGATLALVFASMIDVPSVVSIIGAMIVRKLWQVGLVVILASVSGELLATAVLVTYAGPEFFLHRLVGQTVVGLLVFYFAKIWRKGEPIAKDGSRGIILYYAALLALLLGTIALFAIWIAQGSSSNISRDAELDSLNSRILENIHIREKQNEMDFIK